MLLSSAEMPGTPDDRSLEAYKNDVFLSYRHADNTTGWVTALQAVLETRIAQLLGLRKSTVWRDPSLRAGDVLWDTIEPEVASSAIFISVLSPGYVKSEGCLREARQFRDVALRSDSLIVDSKSRWIRIIKTPYPAEDEPDFLRAVETITLPFYEAVAQSDGKFREFSAQMGMPRYERFAETAEELAQAVCGLLQKMQRKVAKPAAGRPQVFLANTTSDRLVDRAFVAAELSAECDVVPEESVPVTTREELEAVTGEHLQGCRVALHILGARFGAQPEGEDERSVPQMQFDRAADARRLVWIPDDLGTMEPRQAEFCHSVESLKADSLEVIRAGRQDFLQHVRDVLAQLAQPPETPALGKSVYLVSDQEDLARSQLRDLANCLLGHGFFVEQPVFEGSLDELRQAEIQSLLDADVTVIYFGTAPDSWVRSRRREILRKLGELNLAARRLRVIYLCSPETSVKRAVYYSVPNHQLPEPGGPPLWILGDCTDFQCDKMAPLFQSLAAGKNA